MIPVINTKRFYVEDGGSYLRVVARSARLAYRLNKILSRYPDDVTFTDQDEVLFKVTEQSQPEVYRALGLGKAPRKKKSILACSTPNTFEMERYIE
jgi:hypothetical protein